MATDAPHPFEGRKIKSALWTGCGLLGFHNEKPPTSLITRKGVSPARQLHVGAGSFELPTSAL